MLWKKTISRSVLNRKIKCIIFVYKYTLCCVGLSVCLRLSFLFFFFNQEKMSMSKWIFQVIQFVITENVNKKKKIK